MFFFFFFPIWLQPNVKKQPFIRPNDDLEADFYFLWSLYDEFGRCEGKWMYIFVQTI